MKKNLSSITNIFREGIKEKLYYARQGCGYKMVNFSSASYTLAFAPVARWKGHLPSDQIIVGLTPSECAGGLYFNPDPVTKVHDWGIIFISLTSSNQYFD